MQSLYGATNWVAVVMAAAACAWLGKALFGSFLAAELLYRLRTPRQAQLEQLRRLQWELQNRVVWDPAVVRGDATAARQPLADDELVWRRRAAERIARGSVGLRAVEYLAGCTLCQCGWGSLLIVLLGCPVRSPAEFVLNLCGYAGLAWVLREAVGWLAPAAGPAASGHRRGCPGGNCGG